MIKLCLIIILFLAFPALPLFANPASTHEITPGDWRAGTARADVTPAGPMWMAGWMRDRPTTEASQQIWIKALALEDSSGTRSILFTADLCGISADMTESVASHIALTHQIPRSHVLINVSHNHSGPYIEGYLPFNRSFIPDSDLEKAYEYKQLLTETMIRLADEALSDMTAVNLHLGTGFSDFSINRRNNAEDQIENLREEGRLKGPVDHSVPVMRISDNAGENKAIVFSYASHPVVYMDYTWNGDYPGYAQAALEKEYPGAAAFFVAGAGGDSRPMPRGSLDYARKYGEQLADAVNEVLADQMEPVTGNIHAAFDNVELGFQSIPTYDELLKDTKAVNGASPYEPGGIYSRERALHLLAIMEEKGLEKPPSTYDYPVQVWKFGEKFILTGLGGELVVDYALRLKKELDAPFIWVAGYSNDVMGYIPSERVLSEGGYEGADSHIVYGLPSPWAEGIEEKITGKVHELMNRLQR